MAPTIGMSQFARERHRPGTGNSYTLMTEEQLIYLVGACWEKRKPGKGETGLDRKVVVPVPWGGFYMPTIGIQPGLPVRAEVTRRQEGEDYFVETYVSLADVERLGLVMNQPNHVEIVCYSSEALLENNGTRSTDCDWEIVAILASERREGDEDEPMRPLTMARNFLQKEGGTKSEYTAEEFAKAIYYWSTKGGIKVKDTAQVEALHPKPKESQGP